MLGILALGFRHEVSSHAMARLLGSVLSMSGVTKANIWLICCVSRFWG